MKKHIKLLIVLGILLVGSFSFYLFKGYKKDTVVYENNKIKPSSSGIAMMFETSAGSGNYEITTRSEWPTEGYVFNANLSKCENGSELSWDNENKKVLMSGNKSDKCYVYFDVYVKPVINDVTINGLSNDSNSWKMEIFATKGTADIKTYYYSIDNGTTYITSNNNSHTFTLSSSGTYNCYFYVEDINGVKSNVFSKSFHVSSLAPSKEVFPIRGTITNEDGEIIDVLDTDSLNSYLTVSNSSLETETIDGYSAITIFDVNFNNLIDADVIYYVPGVKSGDTIIVKQYVSGKWSIIDATVVGDVNIKFKLTQPGTIAIYRKTS